MHGEQAPALRAMVASGSRTLQDCLERSGSAPQKLVGERAVGDNRGADLISAHWRERAGSLRMECVAALSSQGTDKL